MLAGFFSGKDDQTAEVSGRLVADWSDVRDVSLLHVLVLEHETSGGERFSGMNGEYCAVDELPF